MAEDYQQIIRGSPVERKPDRRDLDAALQADMHTTQDPNYHDPALFITAVVEATVGANLIKELFDVKVAQLINSPSPHADPRMMHICDPAAYNSAITAATLNGWVHQGFFNKFVAERAVYQVFRTEHYLPIDHSPEPRGSFPTQVTQRNQSFADRVSDNILYHGPQALYTPRAWNDEVNHENVARSRSDQRQQHAPLFPPLTNPFSDQLSAQPRRKHARLLPDQSDAWAAVQRGREYEGSRRRSRSPRSFDQPASPDRTRNQLSNIESRQEDDAILDDRYRDRGSSLHAVAPHDYEFDDAMQHKSALPAPETARTPARPTSPGHLPPSLSGNTARRELCLETGPNRVIDEPEPGSAQSKPNYPSAHCSPSHDDPGHVHDTSANDCDRVQGGGTQENNAVIPAAMALQPSAIEPRLKKNLSAVCVGCWCRGVKCDSQVVCRECSKGNRPCIYVLCPLRDCPRDKKCPAYHTWKGQNTTRCLSSSMHLIALLKLDPPSPAGYDLRPVQSMFAQSDSAADIYRRIAAELEEAVRSGERIRREFVKRLVSERGIVCRALPFKIDLIVELMAEKK